MVEHQHIVWWCMATCQDFVGICLGYFGSPTLFLDMLCNTWCIPGFPIISYMFPMLSYIFPTLAYFFPDDPKKIPSYPKIFPSFPRFFPVLGSAAWAMFVTCSFLSLPRGNAAQFLNLTFLFLFFGNRYAVLRLYYQLLPGDSHSHFWALVQRDYICFFLLVFVFKLTGVTKSLFFTGCLRVYFFCTQAMEMDYPFTSNTHHII